MKLSAGKIWGLRRLADQGGRFKMTAVDQRPPIKDYIKKRLDKNEAPWREVAEFKKVLVEELQSESSALLLDPHFAYPHAISSLAPAKGLVVTLEDSLFQETPDGRLSSEIDHWSVEKIKRIGGDAVKVLAWYRPDATPDICQAQQDYVERIGKACTKYDIPFVFELLLYPLAKDTAQATSPAGMKAKKPDLVLRSVTTFADPKFGVDLFKLESPLAAEDTPGIGNAGWEEAQRWFDRLGEATGRPWVMLSAGADMAAFRNILSHAYQANASGYLAGRAIWLKAFQKYPDWDALRAALSSEAVAYMRDLNRLTDAQAMPWQEHPCFAGDGARVQPADGSFRYHYANMET